MFIQTKKQLSKRIPPAYLFASAQLAMVIMIILVQFRIPNTNFIQGLLCGYSIVVNLGCLIRNSRTGKEK